MRRREFIGLIGGAAAWPLAARAQQTKKTPRIGVLWQAKDAKAQADLPSFRAGFKDVGYAEGDLIFEDRFWDSGSSGSLERLDSMAKELVDLKCDVLVGVAIPSSLALRRHTSTMPIVFCIQSKSDGIRPCEEPQSPRRKCHRGDADPCRSCPKARVTAQGYHSRIVERGNDLGPVP